MCGCDCQVVVMADMYNIIIRRLSSSSLLLTVIVVGVVAASSGEFSLLNRIFPISSRKTELIDGTVSAIFAPVDRFNHSHPSVPRVRNKFLLRCPWKKTIAGPDKKEGMIKKEGGVMEWKWPVHSFDQRAPKKKKLLVIDCLFPPPPSLLSS